MRHIAGLITIVAISTAATADEITRPMHGLFAPERADDLKEVLKNIPELELVKADYDKSEATFKFDLLKLMPNANPKKPPKPEEIEQRINNLLSSESRGTFRLKPLNTFDARKLQKHEFNVGIHDCKACRYGVYLALVKLDGVHRATVTAPNRLTVWVDPEKLDRPKLEASLKKDNLAVLTAK